MRAQCRICDRPTYRGCGAHVEQVLADVPVSERCFCGGEDAREDTPRARRSWLSRRR